jgi:hypothetical protein
MASRRELNRAAYHAARSYIISQFDERATRHFGVTDNRNRIPPPSVQRQIGTRVAVLGSDFWPELRIRALGYIERVGLEGDFDIRVTTSYTLVNGVCHVHHHDPTYVMTQVEGVWVAALISQRFNPYDFGTWRPEADEEADDESDEMNIEQSPKRKRYVSDGEEDDEIGHPKKKKTRRETRPEAMRQIVG